MSLSMVVYTHIYGYEVSHYMIGALVFLLLLALIKTRSLSYVICAGVFGIYLLFAIRQVFFPIYVNDSVAEITKSIPFMSGVNLIPFIFDIDADILRELALNVLLFIPFGFGISFLVPLKPKTLLLLAPVFGSSAEAIQLIISLIIGHPYRVIDINDAIMNTLGYLIGYGLFRLFAWGYVWVTHRLCIRHFGITAYVYDVSATASNPAST